MTYMAAGKQFIVVGVGGKEHAREWIALTLDRQVSDETDVTAYLAGLPTDAKTVQATTDSSVFDTVPLVGPSRH